MRDGDKHLNEAVSSDQTDMKWCQQIVVAVKTNSNTGLTMRLDNIAPPRAFCFSIRHRSVERCCVVVRLSKNMPTTEVVDVSRILYAMSVFVRVLSSFTPTCVSSLYSLRV